MGVSGPRRIEVLRVYKKGGSMMGKPLICDLSNIIVERDFFNIELWTLCAIGSRRLGANVLRGSMAHNPINYLTDPT